MHQHRADAVIPAEEMLACGPVRHTLAAWAAALSIVRHGCWCCRAAERDSRPRVLMVMGLAASLDAWKPQILDMLAPEVCRSSRYRLLHTSPHLPN